MLTYLNVVVGADVMIPCLQAILAAVLEAWCKFMSRRVSLDQMAEFASTSRSKRIMGEVSISWISYAVSHQQSITSTLIVALHRLYRS